MGVGVGTGRGKPEARAGGVSGLNVSIYTCTNACIRGVALGGGDGRAIGKQQFTGTRGL